MVFALFSILTYCVSFPPVAPIISSYFFTFQFFPFVTGVPISHASLSNASMSLISGEYLAGPFLVDLVVSFQGLFLSGKCLCP